MWYMLTSDRIMIYRLIHFNIKLERYLKITFGYAATTYLLLKAERFHCAQTWLLLCCYVATLQHELFLIYTLCWSASFFSSGIVTVSDASIFFSYLCFSNFNTIRKGLNAYIHLMNTWLRNIKYKNQESKEDEKTESEIMVAWAK